MEQREALPAGVEVFRITGPLFFGVAGELLDALRRVGQKPRVIVLRMRLVPLLDASGARALEEFVQQARIAGVALVPTRGRQIEGGVKWQPRHGVLITANYYDIVESNRPTNDPLDPINVFQTGKIASKGVEVEAAVSVPGNVELTAAYSYNDAKVTESLFAPEVGQRLSDVPRHMASLWGVKTLRLNAAAALRVGAGVRYIGDTESTRSEEHTSELQSLMRISYAVFCLKKKK